jgi:hypothetical protein
LFGVSLIDCNSRKVNSTYAGSAYESPTLVQVFKR